MNLADVPTQSPEAAARPLAAPSRRPGTKGRQIQLAVCIALWSIISYLLISHFILMSVEVKGTSMSPTLLSGDRYILYRCPYLWRSPRQGEIVVIKDPQDQDLDIKRVIALPNDLVEIRRDGVFVNGIKLSEPYLASFASFASGIRPVKPTRLGHDDYFVLGDNRGVSADSRLYGPVPRKYILGLIAGVAINPNYRRVSLHLHLLRHGQTPFSRDNVFCGAGLDPELTSDGQAMARAFAAAYQSTAWNAVYASPLRRTVATAQPLCDATGLRMELRDDLKEIHYGQWEGQTVETVDREHHDEYLRWSADPAWNAPTGGEPAVAIARRSLQVIEEIRQRFSDGHVLVVSHKATIRIILCGLLGIDVGRFRYRIACPVGSVSVVEFTTEGPLLHALADRSHLDEKLRLLRGT